MFQVLKKIKRQTGEFYIYISESTKIMPINFIAKN